MKILMARMNNLLVVVGLTTLISLSLTEFFSGEEEKFVFFLEKFKYFFAGLFAIDCLFFLRVIYFSKKRSDQWDLRFFKVFEGLLSIGTYRPIPKEKIDFFKKKNI